MLHLIVHLHERPGAGLGLVDDEAHLRHPALVLLRQRAEVFLGTARLAVSL
jgi:hypothetical protein